jgi:hypothetical protein
VPVSYLCERKLLLSPSGRVPYGTAFEIRRRFRNPGLTCWNGRFRPSTTLPDWVQTQPRRSSHADSVTNRILQASANFQTLSQSYYPLLLRSPSLLLLARSTLPIQIRAIVVFQVAIVNPPSTDRRTPRDSPASQYLGSLRLCSDGRQKNRELEKPRSSPLPPHQAQRHNTRKDEE